MLLAAIACATFCATLLGGLVALYLKDKLHLVLGFSAGAVVAVAFFDLLPEAIDIGAKYYSPATLLSATALGFLLYLLLDRAVVLHGRLDAKRGAFGAASMSAHSFLDGIAIGFAYQVSVTVGAIVAIGVLTHDFSDGINTTNLVLKSGGSRQRAFRWLLVDAIAPVFGILSTRMVVLPEQFFSIVLALFGGFFLYIGASELIPESHHAHPKFLTTALTLAGVGFLYLAVNFAGL